MLLRAFRVIIPGIFSGLEGMTDSWWGLDARCQRVPEYSLEVETIEVIPLWGCLQRRELLSAEKGRGKFRISPRHSAHFV
jgi:hypothetical protein